MASRADGRARRASTIAPAPAPSPRDAIVAGLTALYARWVTTTTTIASMRDDWDAFVVPTPMPVAVDDVVIGTMPARWYGGAPSADDCVILQLHGGGYQVGSSRSHHDLCAVLHDACGAKVLAIDYRLAPEHRFPAAVDDTLAAWEHLVGSGIDASRIAVAGDSAGGALAITLATTLHARDEAGPVALALMSPWVDLTLTASSLETNAPNDPVTSRGVLQRMAHAYLGRGGDPRDPRASPVFADLSGLPPMLVQVASDEALFDDARTLAVRARADDVVTYLDVRPGMFHAFQIFAGRLPEAAAAVRDAADFLDRHLAAAHAST